MLTDEVKNQLKGLSRVDIIDKIKRNEIVPPTGEDRTEFLKLAGMDPDERDKVLSTPATAASNADASTDANSDGKSNQDDTNAGDSSAASTPESWWKRYGYESEEKAEEAHKNLLATHNSLQATIDGLNAKEGKRGQKLKELQEENQRLLSEFDELKKKTVPEIKKPVKPVRPNPKDFGDGVFDEKYIEAQRKFDEDNDRYIDEMINFTTKQTEEKINTIQETVKKVPAVVDDDVPPASNSGYDKLFKQDIPVFQKELGLETTVSIEEISETCNRMNSSDARLAASAKQFYSSIPKADLDTYAKVKKAVELAYDFSSGQPVPKYRSIKGALYDNDEIGEGKTFNVIKPSSLSVAEEKAAIEARTKQNSESVAAISSDKTSTNDKNLAGAQTTEEKKMRYKTLMTDYNIAINRGKSPKDDFEKSEKFSELSRLRMELFGTRFNVS